ncbi:MFS transporter [Actinorhabdospora filicis]|uniref:MFS transporter n=1 Tax=Actinorhabdospora filicis TaxID=1785913 RepID=A0A9W6SHS1_9ACTN|nr:MFS transporter [Actinorhabdospora filicis]GLZ76215.1 MFS transporter [Actinorhabdospora filicis]
MSDPSPMDKNPRRWWAFAVIAGAQLVLMLDAVVVNIALPSAQAELGLSDGDRQWVITAYTLAFGGLLLLGGRLGDLFGRNRTFVVGLIGFAAASALGGAATTPGVLLAGRALQGVFASILAPTILSLIVLTFTEARERARAFGLFGMVGAAGGSVGLVLGGMLTEWLNWRWTMYVNIPVALAAAVAGARLLPPAKGESRGLDLPGTVLGTLGIGALVYGLSRAESDGWDAPLVLGLLAGAVASLVLFAVWQTRARHPLVPLRIFRDRTRAGGLLTVFLMLCGNFGMFLFSTYYMQGVLHMTPLRTGLGYLPMTGLMIAVSMVAMRRLTHLPAVALIVPGLALVVTGMLLLSRIDAHGSYAADVLAPAIVLGAGMGLVFGRVMALSTLGVRPADTGAAAAMTNVAQQVGGSVGPALLNTIALTVTVASTDPLEIATAGFRTGFLWSAGLAGTALLAAVLLIRAPGQPRAASVPERQPEPAAA